MDLGLGGKAVVLTGASRGIGKAAALAFAAEGANVSICARGAEALDAAAAEIGASGVRVHAAVCDVKDPRALVGFLEASRAALGSVDVLVNGASGFSPGNDEASWEAGWAVDVMTTVRATQTVVPWMEAAGGGAIVNVASIAALTAGMPPAYSAAKAAVISQGKNAALELAPKGIRVNTVAPGSIDFPGGIWDRIRTGMPEHYAATLASIPSGRFGRPEEVADAIVYLASARASWISGVCLEVDGVQHRGAF